jgi:hypothetical protein
MIWKHKNANVYLSLSETTPVMNSQIVSVEINTVIFVYKSFLSELWIPFLNFSYVIEISLLLHVSHVISFLFDGT